LHENVGKRWVATPVQGDRLISYMYNTIKNSFLESGMFPVSYQKDLKKMRYYNKGKHIAEQLETTQPSGGASETHDVPSIEEGG